MSKTNPASVDEAISRVQSLLSEGQVRKAIELLLRADMGNSELRNAYGVCLMRAGELDKAVDVYQSLCLNGTICLKPNVSTLHMANYAAALLLKGNLSGCLAALHQAPDQSHPAAHRVKDAIQRWRRSLTWMQRLRLVVFGHLPEKPVDLGTEPGNLTNGANS
jgi:Flp pilus assembly protein TadD